MERASNHHCNGRGCMVLLCFTLAAACFNVSEAGRSSMHLFEGVQHSRKLARLRQTIKKISVTKHFDLASLLLQRETMDPTNVQPYVSSPFTLPPYESLPPISLPENSPPFCVYPPNTPQTPPSTTIPTPTGYTPSPPSPSFSYGPPVLPIPSPPPSPIGTVPAPPVVIPNPPVIIPGPPAIIPSPPEIIPGPPIIIPGTPEGVPSPTVYVPSPPDYEPGPPSYVPSPPTYIPGPPTNLPPPSGGGFVPSPPVFIPPIVYPPPTVPPPPRIVQPTARWCVAKPTVPDPILQEAMNYACGSLAECDSIQPNGPCFKPNTVNAHSSYAFNSYWQRAKVAGGTCSFGGTAMLVTVDPSFDGCHFLYA